MSGKHCIRPVGTTALILGVVVLLFEITPIDLQVQDQLFDFESQKWLVDRDSKPEKVIFYTGPKVLIITLAIAVGTALAVTCITKGPPERARRLALFLSCLIIVPIVLSGSRNFTDVYCPYQLARYGGDKAYVKILEHYPDSDEARCPGKCFPAGHAGGGFALMAGFFVFDRRRSRWFALAGAVAVGWIMGIYQMFKGAHFLSHTLVSMCGAWLLILLLASFWDRFRTAVSVAIPASDGASGA